MEIWFKHSNGIHGTTIVSPSYQVQRGVQWLRSCHLLLFWICNVLLHLPCDTIFHKQLILFLCKYIPKKKWYISIRGIWGGNWWYLCNFHLLITYKFYSFVTISFCPFNTSHTFMTHFAVVHIFGDFVETHFWLFIEKRIQWLSTRKYANSSYNFDTNVLP